MDSRIGLDYIVENKEYTAKLGSGEKNSFDFFGKEIEFDKFLGINLKAHWLQWSQKGNLCSFEKLQPVI